MGTAESLTGSQLPDEERRMVRLLEIVQAVIRQPGYWKRKMLAERYGLTERQITKDLTMIRRLGLDLRTEHEGYFFERIPRLPAVTYSFDEALALLLAARASQQLGGVSSAELAAAIARLESLFPPDFAPLLRQMVPRPAVTVQGRRRQELLALASRALVEGRKLRMVYETWSRGGEVNERVVHPYHLLPYLRSWQMIAYCEWRQDILIFKVDRIREATLLEERYQVPPDFDVEDYMGATWGLLRGQAAPPVDVALCFEAEAGHWALEDYPHPSLHSEPQPDGRLLLTLHIAVTAEFVNWLLYFGPRVVVLAPPALRERVAEEHRRAAALYTGPTGG